NTDIIHCNDWQTALIPLYLKKSPGNKIKTLFTIHNMAYQGLFNPTVMPELDLPPELFTSDTLEFYGNLNFMKSGIIYSDAISTVSQRYSQEIQSKDFGCGLDGLLRTRKSELYGIANGADYEVWSPKRDKHIAVNYDLKSIAKKEECKKDLLKYFGLVYDKKKPVISMITRLAEQKGIDLVADNIKKILDLGAYFVLLGTGDEKYNKLFTQISQQYKDSTGIKIAFDNTLAHKIEAGSDMFLMPSRYEPCGLNQIYSLKYGTVPIVSATGGLEDTIQDFNPSSLSGNGLKISPLSSENLYATIKKATKLYTDKKKWLALQKNGLKSDFSWEKSAKNYLKLYEKIIKQ
ncbi:MAG: glycogen synthase, partial [Candidatus Omnitrophota bacterium]